MGQGDAPDRLDTILFDDLSDLLQAREAEDARISAYVDGLDEAALARRFRYRRASTPQEFEQPLAPALLHVFNHQTHHRGQVHAILTGLGRDAPALDLMHFSARAGSACSRGQRPAGRCGANRARGSADLIGAGSPHS
jgi:uncharacterized damage-inducible protein DinB